MNLPVTQQFVYEIISLFLSYITCYELRTIF